MDGSTDRAIVYAAIDSERDHQDAWRGNWEHQGHPSVGEEILLMEHYLAAARQAWAINRGGRAALVEVRKVVALGVRAMENHGAPVRPPQ